MSTISVAPYSFLETLSPEYDSDDIGYIGSMIGSSNKEVLNQPMPITKYFDYGVEIDPVLLYCSKTSAGCLPIWKEVYLDLIHFWNEKDSMILVVTLTNLMSQAKHPLPMDKFSDLCRVLDGNNKTKIEKQCLDLLDPLIREGNVAAALYLLVPALIKAQATKDTNAEVGECGTDPWGYFDSDHMDEEVQCWFSSYEDIHMKIDRRVAFLITKTMDSQIQS